MSNVSSVNGAYGASGVSGGLGGVAGLTPDALVAYCSAQLNGIDGQITSYEQQQQAQLAEKQAIQHAGTAMSQFGTSGPQNQEQWDATISGIRAAAAELPPNDPVAAKLYSEADALQSKYCQGVSPNPHYPSTGEWSSDSQQFTDMGNNVSSAAEIQMIELQSLVSKRATVVQLTTNMMSTMTQSEQNVAQKI
jgi:hypothetical protein